MWVNDLKLLLQFKNPNIYEEVSQSYLQVLGSNLGVQILDNDGYVMKENQYLMGDGFNYVGFNCDVSTSFTMGFWLYPICPGVVLKNDGLVSSITMPLIDFNEIGSTNLSIIKLTETSTIDGYNYLTVYLNNTDYTASTSAYSSAQWHHFWITYDGNRSLFLIYLDGILQSLNSISGSIPSVLSGEYLDLYINHNLEGYSSTIGKNTGYLRDLFLFNTCHSDSSEIQRVINDDILYLADDNYVSTYIDKKVIYFNDPDTVTVTSAIDDMSYIYIARNDGKIMRGSPYFWEVRRIFSNPKEVQSLGLSSENINSGFLNITDKIIRL